MKTSHPWATALGAALALLSSAAAVQEQLPHSVWIEAEHLGPIKGGNFSFQKVDVTTKGTWSLSGPGVAPEWTMGGESEFLSIATRADEAGEVTAGRDVEIPAAGRYTLWVRYGDYRNKKETFGVRIKQGGNSVTHVFGEAAVIDELDPMKLYWEWSFGWGSTAVDLAKGPARVELYTTGPTEARRQVDCLCLTTDAKYRPIGREKPDFAAWRPLRELRKAGLPDVEPLAAKPVVIGQTPKAWRISDAPPALLWNVGTPWQEELQKPVNERLDHPFAVDPPILNDFLAMYRGKPAEQVPLYGDKLAGPVWHIPMYPAAFADGSPFLAWLDAHPDKRFAVLLNYGDPSWPAGATDMMKQAARAKLETYKDRFIGYVAGESISYAYPDQAALEPRVAAAKSRAEVLAILREAYTAETVKKFAAYYGKPVTPEEAWGPVISCLSANNEAFTHALGNWGCKRIGHENTGNSPTLARRLAFLRGAARQFGAKLVDYQSINLGDSATMFSREHYSYPGSAKYVIDNSYDVWAGAGVNWLLKDYLLWHLAGVDAFYNEQGIDMYWKPGGNAAGDDWPVQLSPKGKTAQAIARLVNAHPRGTQYTPVAFLLDEAHGYSQERFEPGSFSLHPHWNPAVLTPGDHEAAIRGWFDVAYYPAPETQNQAVSGGRQTYVNGIFGDVFDVIATAPDKADIVNTYPVVIASGEVTVSEQWGAALKGYVESGGTLVVCADQLDGPGVAALGLPAFGAEAEASAFEWKTTGKRVQSNVFRYRNPAVEGAKVLATAGRDDKPVAVALKKGQGQVIVIGVPLGLGVDDRPVPVLSMLMPHLVQGLLPLKVTGDVEWTLNRLDDGGWAVGLLNNRGIYKPQHGITPTDHAEAQEVTVTAPFKVARSAEWMNEADVPWQAAGNGSSTTITVPAGAVRVVVVYPAP